MAFCYKASTNKLEKLQLMALRLVYGDCTSSYEDLLQRAKMLTLYISRLRSMPIEVFKILHGISPSI